MASSNFYNLFLRGLNLCQEKHCLLNGIIRLTWFLVVHVKFLVSCILNDPYSVKEIRINSCFILCSDNRGKTTLNEEVILRLGENKWANKYTNKISRSGTDFFTKTRVGWSKSFHKQRSAFSHGLMQDSSSALFHCHKYFVDKKEAAA